MSGLILSLGQFFALSFVISLGIYVLVILTERVLKSSFGVLVRALSR